jgi:hypothetical protein
MRVSGVVAPEGWLLNGAEVLHDVSREMLMREQEHY